MRPAILTFVLMQFSFSQEPYDLPFASSGNILELTVANSSSNPTSNVMVKAMNIPTWLKISPTTASFAELMPNEELLVSFTFSLDRETPVNTVQTLRFVITNSIGESWSKEIQIAVGAPESFELFQNFPNPFNPITNISYQLSAEARVSVRIYDILGREVEVLVDADRPAGYHQELWDASQYASGMYIYQLILTDQQGNRQAFRKTMLLVK